MGIRVEYGRFIKHQKRIVAGQLRFTERVGGIDHIFVLDGNGPRLGGHYHINRRVSGVSTFVKEGKLEYRQSVDIFVAGRTYRIIGT